MGAQISRNYNNFMPHLHVTSSCQDWHLGDPRNPNSNPVGYRLQIQAVGSCVGCSLQVWVQFVSIVCSQRLQMQDVGCKLQAQVVGLCYRLQMQVVGYKYRLWVRNRNKGLFISRSHMFLGTDTPELRTQPDLLMPRFLIFLSMCSSMRNEMCFEGGVYILLL